MLTSLASGSSLVRLSEGRAHRQKSSTKAIRDHGACASARCNDQHLARHSMSDAGRPPSTGKALMSGCAHQSMSRPASPPQSSSSLWGRSLAAAGSVSDTCSCPPCRSRSDINALPSAMSCFHICTPTADTSLFHLPSHTLQIQGARVAVEVYLTLLACPPQCLWEQPDRLGPLQTAYACSSQ